MLTIYSLQQSAEWDILVRSFKEYDTYWLSGYVKAFKIHGDGEPMLFYYSSEDTRGICVVMKRDIAKCKYFSSLINENEYYDFASPYGYGGWLIEGENADRLFEEYNNWCNDNNIVSEFVRYHPVIKNHLSAANNYEITELGKTVSLDLTSSETIWNNITSKNRNMIRKAQKNGVKIFNGRHPNLFREFKKIYNSTMNRDSADSYYYFSDSFYESICDDLPYNSQIFFAEYDKKIIAASIMLMTNKYMNYHLSGSLFEYANLAPTNLLLYEAALWGSANGYKSLYLGGGVGSGEDNLFKFKKSFYRNDDLNSFYIGKKIYNNEKYSELVSKRKIYFDDSFFPRYRAKG